MSFSRLLIKPYQEHDDFALSWQAGIAGSQGLTKLNNFDIESVNVTKTCEKLNFTLQDTSTLFIDESQGHVDLENQCAVRIRNIPFRAVTNIWFGTLKIYQQQVNNLFRLSKDLLERSTKHNLNHSEAIKRKSSVIYDKVVKKRRLTISNSNKKTIISSNYSQLLDELENLTQDPVLNSFDEFPSAMSNTRAVTQLQIREITICETNTTTFATNDIEDDSGFGEATYDEIEYFYNFMGGNNSNQDIGKVSNSPVKRKCCAEQGIPAKQYCYSFECSPEEPNLNGIVSNHKSPVSSFNGFSSPVKDSFSELKNNNNLKTVLKGNINYIKDMKDIKQELMEDYNPVKQNFSKIIKKNNKSKLVIDICTKIDVSEILDAMKKSKPVKRSFRKKLLQFLKIKKFATALDLLNTFNRRSLKLSQILKQKVYYSHEQFKKDYSDILRDILKQNYNKKLASEIYPGWIYSYKLRKQNKKQHIEIDYAKEVETKQQEIDLNNSSDYLNTVTIPTLDYLPNEHTNLLPYNDHNDENNNSLTNCNQYEWRPYCVMQKLLNLWRFHETSETEPAILFKLAKNRFDKALGFYSLLMLSKNRFVVLKTFPETIIIQKILMGEATKTVANNLS